MTHAEVVEVQGTFLHHYSHRIWASLQRYVEMCHDFLIFICIFSQTDSEKVDPFSHFTRLLTELPGKSAQSVCFGSSKKSSSNLDIHNLPTQGIKSDWTESSRDVNWIQLVCAGQFAGISKLFGCSKTICGFLGKFGGIFHRGYLVWKSTQTEFWIRTVCRWPWATTRDQLSSNRMSTDRRAEGSGEFWWFSSTECCQRYPKAKASSKW